MTAWYDPYAVGAEAPAIVPPGPYKTVADLIAALQSLPQSAKPLMRLPNGYMGPMGTPHYERCMEIGTDLYEVEQSPSDYIGQTRVIAVVIG